MDEASVHTPEARYAALVAAFHAKNPQVTLGTEKKRGFGATALCINSKIFAMLMDGKLVLKLPRPRVDALVAAGAGMHFVVGAKGRPMREWLALAPDAADDWQALAEEALAFVGRGPGRR